MTSKHKNTRSALILVAVVAIIIGVFVQQSNKTPAALPDLEKVVILPNSKALNPVIFTDNKGQTFTKDSLKGYWNILFFGYTNCPDICPTTMRTLAQVKQSLSDEKKWGNYRVIMVSVDADRDSIERLNNYVPYFDEEFIGLRADAGTTTEFAKQLGILFVKQESANDFYEVDHSASMILINPQAEMAGVITAPHQVEQISADLLLLADHFSDDHASPPVAGNTTQLIKVVSDERSETAEQHLASDTASSSELPIEGLTFENAWIRPAPPSTPSMAAYFTLKNSSDSNITLVAAQSTGFAMAMIHNTVIEDGIAKMQHRSELIIPAGSQFKLEPLGTHLMLMQPKQELGLGESAEITLIADNGARLTHQVEVKQPSE